MLLLNFAKCHRAFRSINFLLLLCLCSCSQEEIIGGLTERQAADVISILAHSGISASREKQGQDRFRVMVSASKFAQAILLIRESIPPEDRAQSLDKVLKGGGLTPLTPEMHAVRLDFALAMQIERQLLAYPGVVYVRANVSSKLGDRAGITTPSASVVIRFLSTTGNVPFSEEDVQRTVSKLVPGLDAKDIALSVSNVVSPHFAGEGLPDTPQGQLVAGRVPPYLLISIALALMLIAGSAAWVLRSRRHEEGMQRSARVRKPTDKVRLGERL